MFSTIDGGIFIHGRHRLGGTEDDENDFLNDTLPWVRIPTYVHKERVR